MATQVPTLPTDKLRQYLAILVNLEQKKYFSDKLIEKLEHERNQLKSQLSASAPVAPQKTVPQKTAKGGALPLILIAAGVIIGASTGGSGGWIIGVPMIIFGIVLLRDYNSASKRDSASAKAAASNYNSAVASYNREKAQYETRKKKANARLQVVNKTLSLAYKDRDSLKKCLDKYYGLNIIYPAYRGLTNICMLYEYVDSGRAHSLQQTGTDQGAYNILGQEVLMHKVLLKLDEILQNLQQIKQNQNTLYKSIVITNSKLDDMDKDINNMSDRLDKISQNTSEMNSKADDLIKKSSISAYYAEQSNKQLEYMNRMNYFSGNYGPGSSFNTPPHY